ncbi:MAG TPA: helix-turn-helix transcriptional regulator [Actinopolymorphaceae bacterium]
MSDTNLLGEFLRARRELITPEQVGLPQIGIRRVPGLRREEVAMLAGISADYYLRLEQGRDRSPSRQVLESLARALQLDDDGTEYLLSLAQDRPRTPRRRPRKETVPPGIRLLVETLEFPAFVEGRYFDVLAANRSAAALSPRLVVGNNRLRDVFLDPAEQALYPAWDEVTARLVAGFRSSVGVDVEDQRFVDLVGSLSIASPRFRELWGRQDVARREGAKTSLQHPVVGELTLYREKLPVTGTDGQMLVIYHPEPGTADAEKLSLLIASDLPVASDPPARTRTEGDR